MEFHNHGGLSYRLRACIAVLCISGFSHWTLAQDAAVNVEPDISRHEQSVVLGSDPDNFGFALAVALARTGIEYQNLDVSDKEKEFLRALNTRTDKTNLKRIFGPYAKSVKEALDSPAPNPFYIAELVSEARSEERKFRTQAARTVINQLSPKSQEKVMSLADQEMKNLNVHEHNLLQLAHDRPDVVLVIGRRFSAGVENYSTDRSKPESLESTENGSWGVATR